MKKFLALLLALVMVFALAACGSEDTTPSENPTEPSSEPTTDVSTAPDDGEAAANPDDIDDTMEADTYEVAFVTDVGQLKDKSFNEGTWNGRQRRREGRCLRRLPPGGCPAPRGH